MLEEICKTCGGQGEVAGAGENWDLALCPVCCGDGFEKARYLREQDGKRLRASMDGAVRAALSVVRKPSTP